MANKSSFRFRLHVFIKKITRQFIIAGYWMKTEWRYLRTILSKKCYYGPFTGEFGHLLGHNLPFIAHLYSKGVAVEFCGLEIHKPFFVDEGGKQIVSSYTSIRDYFIESAPDCNTAPEPEDVKKITDSFITKAKKSLYPYWNNQNNDYYYNYFRWWVLKKKRNTAFDISKVYAETKSNTVVIFPRKWNTNFPDEVVRQLKNNGENWDYLEVVKIIAPYFEKVYVIGHPVFSAVNFKSFDNVVVDLSGDNKFILEKCSGSRLIISQHSGTVYLGEYTNTQVLIIYKGARKIGDIEMTSSFKKALGEKYPFKFAYSLEEIKEFVKKYEAT